jgi:hypothetical protein
VRRARAFVCVLGTCGVDGLARRAGNSGRNDIIERAKDVDLIDR